eukprot:72083_1
MSQLLNCKNAKDETLLTVAIRLTTNPNFKFHTNAIKEWLDYLRFDEELNKNDDNLLAFLEEKKKKKEANNRRQNVPTCICGSPMRMMNPAALGRNAGSATCARCSQLQRQTTYCCQNNRNFVVNGRMSRHQGAYIVCMRCFRSETQQKQAALAQQESKATLLIKNNNEYETNPFVTACAFGKEETIEKTIKKTKSKEMWLKLLKCTANNNDKRNIPMHALCKTKCVQSLRLLFVNNKILSIH